MALERTGANVLNATRARRAAKAFGMRVGSLVKRHCIAPATLATALQQETGDLTTRSKMLFKSTYCHGK